jgi:peptidyl-prolyl cis-trans isomerase A (cyclophilin A)
MRHITKHLAVLLLLFLFLSCSTKHPVVRIQTVMGDISVELYPEKAPVTVNNFLAHCERGTFSKAAFYRVVNLQNQPAENVHIEVIQGVLFHDSLVNRHPSIAHETTGQTGIRHLDGTISMARLEPGTASTEFFICVGDQPSLDQGGARNPDGQGFAAFGRVTRGMDVVRAIHALRAPEQMLEIPLEILNISAE